MNSDISTQLQAVLNSTYHLMQRTQVYHWNVKGAAFYSLHEAFEVQYRALFEAVDEIAERIATLGGTPVISAPPSPADTDPEADSQLMLKQLIEAHNAVIGHLKDAHASAADADDEVSQDLALGRISEHEKTVWMLKSTLG